MVATAKDAHIDCHLVMAHCLKKLDGVIDIDQVIVSRVKQQRRGSVFRHLQFVREQSDSLLGRMLAQEGVSCARISLREIHCDDWIDKDHEVWPEIDVVGIRNVGRVEMSACRSCQMASCGEAQNPYAISIKAP